MQLVELLKQLLDDGKTTLILRPKKYHDDVDLIQHGDNGPFTRRAEDLKKFTRTPHYRRIEEMIFEFNPVFFPWNLLTFRMEKNLLVYTMQVRRSVTHWSTTCITCGAEVAGENGGPYEDCCDQPEFRIEEPVIIPRVRVLAEVR
jgi:hypothetical protein